MAPMAVTAWPTTWPERSASVRAEATSAVARVAPSAVWRTVAAISSSAAAVSSRLAACCSVRRDRSFEALAISWVPEPIWPATLEMVRMASSRPAAAALKSFFRAA